jgi:hypothetical protein
LLDCGVIKTKDQRGEKARLFALRTLQIITTTGDTRPERERVFRTHALKDTPHGMLLIRGRGVFCDISVKCNVCVMMLVYRGDRLKKARHRGGQIEARTPEKDSK